MFVHLGVPTKPSDMSVAVSLDAGQPESAASSLFGLFAQPANLPRPRFWSTLRDIRRFYDQAPELARLGSAPLCAAFREDHLLPMAAAIWSASAARLTIPSDALHSVLRQSRSVETC